MNKLPKFSKLFLVGVFLFSGVMTLGFGPIKNITKVVCSIPFVRHLKYPVFGACFGGTVGGVSSTIRNYRSSKTGRKKVKVVSWIKRGFVIGSSAGVLFLRDRLAFREIRRIEQKLNKINENVLINRKENKENFSKVFSNQGKLLTGQKNIFSRLKNLFWRGIGIDADSNFEQLSSNEKFENMEILMEDDLDKKNSDF